MKEGHGSSSNGYILSNIAGKLRMRLDVPSRIISHLSHLLPFKEWETGMRIPKIPIRYNSASQVVR